MKPTPPKSHGMTGEKASSVKREGHEREDIWAAIIGGEVIHGIQKADVVDYKGLAYSVKGGEKKWQIFLYTLGRFERFSSQLEEVSNALLKCLGVFSDRETYELDKASHKQGLRRWMRKTKNLLCSANLIRAFWEEAMFAGDEVDFLVIFWDGAIHVFHKKDVLDVLVQGQVLNSMARRESEVNEQKVIFKYGGTTFAEIEVRTDRSNFGKLKLLIVPHKFMNMVAGTIPFKREWENHDANMAVNLYGNAARTGIFRGK